MESLQLKEGDIGEIRRSSLIDHYELFINGENANIEIADLFSNTDLDTQLYRNSKSNRLCIICS